MVWQLLILLVLLIPILAIVLDSQLGRALAQRLERRALDAGDDLSAERIAFLEAEVERLSASLERLDDESQFLHKLLTERAGEDSPREALPPPPEGDGEA